MQNFHKNRRITALLADIIQDPRRTPLKRAEYALQVLDVLDVIRDGSQRDAYPASRRDVSLQTKLPAATLANIYADLLKRGLIKKRNRLSSVNGRQAEVYVLAGFFRTQGRHRTQSDLVIDLGYAESIQWDIIQDLQDSKVGYAKQVDVKAKYYRRRDPTGRIYGNVGVMAHIEDMISLGYLNRVTGFEALKLVGAERIGGAGRRPILLVRGPVFVHPDQRAKARAYSTGPTTPERTVVPSNRSLQQMIAECKPNIVSTLPPDDDYDPDAPLPSIAGMLPPRLPMYVDDVDPALVDTEAAADEFDADE